MTKDSKKERIGMSSLAIKGEDYLKKARKSILTPLKDSKKELTHITTKCRGETWKEAEARNNYFKEQGKAEFQKKCYEDYCPIMNKIKAEQQQADFKMFEKMLDIERNLSTKDCCKNRLQIIKALLEKEKNG